MIKKNLCVAILIVPVTLCVAASAQSKQANDDAKVAGTWRGESLCTEQAPSACHDEQVVYYIKPVKLDVYSIRADKIVNGKPVTMGEGEWQYDATTHALTWQGWRLKVDGGTIDGTLTLPDKRVVRRMTLKRET